MDYKTIKLNIDESYIATVSLNRPDVRNAMNQIMINELTSCFQDLSSNNTIRVVLLRGNGHSFSAGADLQMMKDSSHQTLEQNKAGTKQLRNMVEAINSCTKPVVGVIHGHAFGGGFGLCTLCDIVIAEEKTLFSLSEVLIGLIPAVIGPYAENKIGKSWFRALGISGEQIDASLARKIGLAHFVIEESKMEMMINHVVKQLLKGGPLAQSKFKDYIKNMAATDSSDLIAEIRASKEGNEGLSAFLEKRKPNWNKN
ncbi:MAG: enoyl-CoA hydratase [Candidatus Marinimicrobia bacterium]|nr:enoyl-CoA hydratase [Candidatus Neomarinimicrobiota bacterium]